MTREVVVSIDDSKIKQDKLWDGVKGCITNTHLTNKEVIENYNHLWRIEKAFRVSKQTSKSVLFIINCKGGLKHIFAYLL